MDLGTPESAILSAIIFNALIIPLLIPLSLKGVRYRAIGATALLRRNLLVYGLGGLIVPFVGIKLIDLVVHNLPRSLTDCGGPVEGLPRHGGRVGKTYRMPGGPRRSGRRARRGDRLPRAARPAGDERQARGLEELARRDGRRSAAAPR